MSTYDKERIEQLQQAVKPYRKKLINHSLYSHLTDEHSLRIFMMHHVFAVWDFMSLVKYLQIQFTCVSLPWKPTQYTEISRLINEIVVAEESDKLPDGSVASHFEMYVRAMIVFGADIKPIKNTIYKLDKTPLTMVLTTLPAAVNEFVSHTFSLIQENKSHKVAAAFTFGREDVIPDMFRAVVKDLNKKNDGTLDLYQYYLDRHIELDEAEHTPLALEMVSTICGDDEKKWQEATDTAVQTIQQRIKLWSNIETVIKQAKETA